MMTTNALTLIQNVHTSSPETAARMHCFLDLFEIFILSVPNLGMFSSNKFLHIAKSSIHIGGLKSNIL